MTPPSDASSWIDQARRMLRARWQLVLAGEAAEETAAPGAVRQAIERSINSKTKSYRYVLPTHLLAKAARPELDARSVQESYGLDGAFDARSFCRQTVVPFDRENHNVLGGSGDPYVSNPLRIAAITPDQLAAQRNQQGFNDLITVLTRAQENPDEVDDMLNDVLRAIRDRLARVHITYPAPSRASLEEVLRVIHDLLEDRTGGRRMQAVSVALFETIGHRFGLFEQARSGHVNASDVRTGHAADLTWLGTDGSVCMAVEVKDRQLAIREVEDKLPQIREANVQELLYVIRGGIEPGGDARFAEIASAQFRSGHNIHICEFDDLLRIALVLFAEAGRRDLLERIGAALDEFGELQDREAWRARLETS